MVTPTMISMSALIGHHQTEETTADAPSGCDEHPTQGAERAACAEDFAHFLNHWHFVNRESGETIRFNNLWPGQRNIVRVMSQYRWCFFLKAGKLGFTELECAFDAWVALYRFRNARVHLFSMNLKSAQALLAIVKFGIEHLPDWLGLPIMSGEAGGDTTTQLKLFGGVDDERTIVSYAAAKNAAIDQSAQHTHCDELARMAWPDSTWSSIESTVVPGGSVHIVTRGAGDGNFVTTLWEKADAGGTPLHPHFEPFDSRPRIPEGNVPEGADPTEVWYAEREATMLPHELAWLAPRTAEDALKGSAEGAFMPEPVWLACYDPNLPPLVPGDMGTQIVLGVDAGVTNDLFAVVAVSRHPDRPADPAIRAVRTWRAKPGEQIDYLEVEDFIRVLCLGGCVEGHPNKPGQIMSSVEGCAACENDIRVARHNVVQLAYDSYQLIDMSQRLSRERVVWCEDFGQGTERLEADALLRQLAVARRLAHRNDPTLNEHIRNANAKIAPGEDTKLRIVKRNPGSKIDAAVGSSMAVSRAMYLNLKVTQSAA